MYLLNKMFDTDNQEVKDQDKTKFHLYVTHQYF